MEKAAWAQERTTRWAHTGPMTETAAGQFITWKRPGDFEDATSPLKCDPGKSNAGSRQKIMKGGKKGGLVAVYKLRRKHPGPRVFGGKKSTLQDRKTERN